MNFTDVEVIVTKIGHRGVIFEVPSAIFASYISV